jgi:hypothetical protein
MHLILLFNVFFLFDFFQGGAIPYSKALLAVFLNILALVFEIVLARINNVCFGQEWTCSKGQSKRQLQHFQFLAW